MIVSPMLIVTLFFYAEKRNQDKKFKNQVLDVSTTWKYMYVGFTQIVSFLFSFVPSQLHFYMTYAIGNQQSVLNLWQVIMIALIIKCLWTPHKKILKIILFIISSFVGEITVSNGMKLSILFLIITLIVSLLLSFSSFSRSKRAFVVLTFLSMLVLLLQQVNLVNIQWNPYIIFNEISFPICHTIFYLTLLNEYVTNFSPKSVAENFSGLLEVVMLTNSVVDISIKLI